MAGGTGADILEGGQGDDRIDGGADIDRVTFLEAVVLGAMVSRSTWRPGASTGILIGTDTLVSIENVTGTQAPTC